MKIKIGITALSISIIGALAAKFFIYNQQVERVVSFVLILLFTTGLFLIIPFNKISYYIFDPNEWEPNKTREELVYKIRVRGLLFNNIATGIFFLIVIVILMGFYLLVHPPIQKGTAEQSVLSTSM